jgi:CBS domain-containing protein
MITDRDICMAAYTQGLPLHAIEVSRAMSNRVFACAPGDDVAHAEQLMREHQIRRLPVVDDAGHVVGVLSMNDVAREAARELDMRKQEVSPRDLVQTLAVVCQPRQAVVVATA